MTRKIIITTKINETGEQEIGVIENPHLAGSDEGINKSLFGLLNLTNEYDEVYLILVDTNKSLETLQEEIKSINNYEKSMQFSDFEPVNQRLMNILEANNVTGNWENTYFTQIS